MSWNHRVWRDEHGGLSIRETYYDESKEITGWDAEPNAPYGFAYDNGGDPEAKVSLGWFLAKMQGALCFPILDEPEHIKKAEAKLAKEKTKKEKLKKKAE